VRNHDRASSTAHLRHAVTTHTHARTHAREHTHSHTHTHPYSRTHKHSRTHTHTHIQASSLYCCHLNRSGCAYRALWMFGCLAPLPQPMRNAGRRMKQAFLIFTSRPCCHTKLTRIQAAESTRAAIREGIMFRQHTWTSSPSHRTLQIPFWA
jgi:hypothetical protein